MWASYLLGMAILVGVCLPSAAQTATVGGGVWTQKSPAASPAGSDGAAMAYDAATGTAVLFGGYNSTSNYLNDTWTWNGVTWTQQAPAATPPARNGAAMAYDAGNGTVVLFGGDNSGELGDTWTWNGTTWTQHSGASPSARTEATMAYDAATGTVLLFGGLTNANGGTAVADTWSWNGTAWTQLSPSASPSARYAPTMAYDATTSAIVLFGGQNNSGTNLADTWNWNGTTWAAASPSTSPPARSFASEAYDSATSNVVLFGGYSGGNLGDTWTWNGTNWTQRSLPTSPSAREVASMAYDTSTATVLLFGGYDGNFAGDTWTYANGAFVPPTSPVGIAAAQTPVYFTIGTSGALGTLSNSNVLTTGLSGLDFTLGTGSTCTGAPAAGSTCTVNVAFTPRAPGQRQGAVNLTNSSGTIIATAYISGTGTGPLGTFTAGVASYPETGFNQPHAVAVDAAGDTYVGNAGGNTVTKYPAGGGAGVAVGGGYSDPTGLCLDGAGTLYVANYAGGNVITVSASGTQSTLSSGWSGPSGCTVDVSGNVYVDDYSAGKLYTVPGNGGPSATKTLLASVSSPEQNALDAAGNIYVGTHSGLYKVPAGGGTATAVTIPGYTLSTATSVALDAAGNLYIADTTNSRVLEESASGVVTILESGNQPWGLALLSGNVYYTDNGNGRIGLLTRSAGVPISFATSTIAGNTDTTDGTKLLDFENDGNAALTIASITTSSINFTFTGTVNGSVAACATSLSSGALCGLGAAFTPKAAGTLTANGVITDNSLNAANATQSVPLSGAGLVNSTTALTLGASPTTTTYGSIVTFTATVTSNSGATGTVTFSDNGVTLGSGMVTNGVATLDSTGLPVGTYNVTAVYSGDSSDAGATSNMVAVTITVPSTAVGTTSATQQVQFNFTSTVTLNTSVTTAVQVLTQGAPNLDFKYVSGGSCAAGATYISGQSCTVEFSFTPAAPGGRLGAVVLYDSSATPVLLAATFIGGTGTGPQVTFPGNTALTTLGGGFSNPVGTAVDLAGNAYVADFNNNAIKKIPSGCVTSSCVVTLGASTTHPAGVAIDGAGNVIVAGYGTNKVFELLAPAYTTTVTLGSGFNYPFGVAVDGSGNVFVGDDGNYKIKEVLAAGGYTTINTLTTVSGYVSGLSVDTSGNVYFAENGNGTVNKLTASGGVVPNNSTPTQIGGSFTNPDDAKVDAAGNVFVIDTAKTTAYEILASSGLTTTITVGSGYNNPQGVAIDGSGNLYIGDSGNNRVVKLDQKDAPALSFASTAVGATSAAQYVALANDGNTALSIASIAASNTNFAFVGAVDGSYAACGSTLASAGFCGLGATFTPKMAGSLSGYGDVTDNSLNAAGSLQTVTLNGTGTQGTKTISFATLTTPVTAGASATLSATTSNNDPVTFSVTAGTATIGTVTSTTNPSTGVITYTATITYTNTGSVTIKADSAATANATDVNASQTVTVNAAATSFTAPTEPVGTTSPTETAAVTFTTAGTLSTISNTNVLTAGLAGGDFKYVSGGTCAMGTAYSVGQTCTVNYTFTPTTPGQRLGGITLTSSANAVLGSAYLTGEGTGPLSVIYPGTLSNVVSGLPDAFGIAIDGSNNLYVVAGTVVYKETYNGSSYSGATIGTTNNPAEVAVDGQGNVYIDNQGTSSILKLALNPATGAYVQSTAVTGISSLAGLAADGGGNLYIADGANIYKETLGASGAYTQSTLATGLNFTFAIAIDASANLYVSDSGDGYVYKYTYSGGTYTQSTIASGLSNNNGITVDASGIVYVVADNTTSGILRYVPNGSGYTALAAVGTGIPRTNGITIDGKGNLFVSSDNTAPIGVYKLDVSDPLTLTYASTAVGSASPAQTVAVWDIGNTALSFTSFAASNGNFANDATSTTCSTGSMLAAAGTCNVGYKFTPQTVGTDTANGVVTDNSLNAGGATQLVSLNGTGTAVQPTVTAVSPTSGTTAGGTTVTITGTNLIGTTSVNFGAAPAASFTIVSSTSITVVSPAEVQGTVDVTVSNGTYTSATSSADHYTFLTADSVTWSPSSHTGYLSVPIGTGVLDATSSTPGTIAYTATNSSNVTVAITSTSTLAMGTYTLTATLTPSNGTYATATATISFTVVDQEIFVANSAGTETSLYDNGAVETSATTGGGIGAAVDANGYVWSIKSGGTSVTKFTDADAVSATYSGAGISAATALAIDGNGVVWIANSGSVSALTNAGAAKSTIAVAQAGNVSTPNAITVDAAGSLWIANTGNNTVTEVIGAAAPVTAPTVQQVTGANSGTKP